MDSAGSQRSAAAGVKSPNTAVALGRRVVLSPTALVLPAVHTGISACWQHLSPGGMSVPEDIV